MWGLQSCAPRDSLAAVVPGSVGAKPEPARPLPFRPQTSRTSASVCCRRWVGPRGRGSVPTRTARRRTSASRGDARTSVRIVALSMASCGGRDRVLLGDRVPRRLLYAATGFPARGLAQRRASPSRLTAALGAEAVSDMTGNATLTGAVDDFNSILASLKPVGAPRVCAFGSGTSPSPHSSPHDRGTRCFPRVQARRA